MEGERVSVEQSTTSQRCVVGVMEPRASLLLLPDTTGVSARFQPQYCRIHPAGGLVVDSPQDEGCPPVPHSTPKIEDSPQEDWGPGG